MKARINTNVSAKSERIPRVITFTDKAASAINVDITDQYQLTAVAAATTTFTITGSGVAGQHLLIRFKDAGVAKVIAWDAVFRAIGVVLPVATIPNKTHYVGCDYNLTDSKWDIVAVGVEA